jgi:4-carboxymuconolactone decarboxylase
VSRVRRLRPDELDPPQREVYAAITTGRRAAGPQLFELVDPDGGLLGPFNAMLAQPAVGMAVQRLGEVLRYDASLPATVREAVVLRVAATWRSEYEWYAHAPLARRAGLPDAVIASLRQGAVDVPADPDVRAAVRLADRMLHREPVDDDVYAEAERSFGVHGLLEIVALVGYYGLLAGLLRTFDVAQPEGAAPAWP